MTATEKTQTGIKFVTEIIGVFVLLCGVFGTYKVNEWRIGRVEDDLRVHLVQQREDIKGITEELKGVSQRQVQVMTNQARILKAVEER